MMTKNNVLKHLPRAPNALATVQTAVPTDGTARLTTSLTRIELSGSPSEAGSTLHSDMPGLDWKSLSTRGAAAGSASRHAHAAFVVGNRLYIHGGRGDDKNFRDDLLILDPVSSTWKAARQAATWPCARGFHTATALESNRVIIFGGK